MAEDSKDTFISTSYVKQVFSAVVFACTLLIGIRKIISESVNDALDKYHLSQKLVDNDQNSQIEIIRKDNEANKKEIDILKRFVFTEKGSPIQDISTR